MYLDELEKLYQLKEKGFISEAEFDAQKKLLLDQENAAAMPKKMVSMKEAYISYWKKSFVWRGRASRAEYWWPVLVNFLIGLATSVISGVFVGLAYLVFEMVTIFPWVAVMVRRFHDLGRSAWVALFPFLAPLVLGFIASMSSVLNYVTMSPVSTGNAFSQTGARMFSSMNWLFLFVGILLIVLPIVWAILMCLPGTKGINKYGPEP